jgi:GNAT superfamily N-acetyltransferase
MSPHAANVRIVHLHDHPQHRQAVAAMIWQEFWTAVPGASINAMAERLAQASDPHAVPLCLVALGRDHSDGHPDVHDTPLGVINLVEHDDDTHTDWTPWLAGLVVRADQRGRGIGSALVRRLLAEARRLGVPRLYFGTDVPAFYARLGARLHLQHSATFCFMRFDIEENTAP